MVTEATTVGEWVALMLRVCIQNLLLMVLMLFSGEVLGAEYFVESPGVVQRQEADTMREMVIAAGVEADAVRVARRYQRGEGWRYFVRVTEVYALEKARSLAQSVSLDGAGGLVYVDDGRAGALLEVVGVDATESTEEGAGSTENQTPDSEAESTNQEQAEPVERQLDEVLRDVINAHGGKGGGIGQVQEASGVSFAFHRAVPTTGKASLDPQSIVAHNHYVRQGDRLRLAVSVVQGAGKDSVTVITPNDQAWVRTNAGVVERDIDRTRKVLERFSPEVLLAIPLGVPHDVRTAEAWSGLQIDGEDDGLLRLRRPSDETEGAAPPTGMIEVGLDAKASTVAYLVWEDAGGTTIYRYKDYRTMENGLVIPSQCIVERDAVLVEDIAVQSYELNPSLGEDFFVRPEAPQE